MIIYTYTLYIYIHYTRIRGSLSVFIRTQHPPPPRYPARNIPFYVRRLSLLCNRNPLLPSPLSLPPSLPPEESWRALPILQYLYFSMLKPRYIINYINKHRSPVISRTNVTYSLGIFLFFFALCHMIENDKVRIIY